MDHYAKEHMRDVRSWPVSKKGRVFIGASGSQVFVYAYGRDFLGEDFWWTLGKRNLKGGSGNTAATKK